MCHCFQGDTEVESRGFLLLSSQQVKMILDIIYHCTFFFFPSQNKKLNKILIFLVEKVLNCIIFKSI
jgi:hypothetical protein